MYLRVRETAPRRQSQWDGMTPDERAENDGGDAMR
jgi:hypothetical protein